MNKTLMITGAGSGVGKAVAETFSADEGTDVSLVGGRQEESLLQVLRICAGFGFISSSFTEPLQEVIKYVIIIY